MTPELTANALIDRGMERGEAQAFVAAVAGLESSATLEEQWRRIAGQLLRPSHPFEVHEYVYAAVFADWDTVGGPPPAWFPEEIDSTNIAWLMQAAGVGNYDELYQWSINDRAAFWKVMVDRVDVRFKEPYRTVMDLAGGVERPGWLAGARLNVVDSCFNASPDSPAIVFQTEDGPLQRVTVAELREMVSRVAGGLSNLGIVAGDRVAVDLPMTIDAVAVYLGAVAAGCAVVTVADSFAPEEIRLRLEIGETKCIFTQDYAVRLDKKLPLYEKAIAAQAPKAIVLSGGPSLECSLREGDIPWDEFLPAEAHFTTAACSPDAFSTILFSSGTTGSPKAIPWDHTTPIKAAIDGHLHHDIHPGDVICWPTNLGWMMGPWLIYAALMNRATVALYYGAPTVRRFGRFVQDAGVTMLGLVPSLVAAWKSSGCMAGLDWSRIRAFSSTGECSKPSDMLFLMSLAGYRPVIEYCGGTEIGGGYITGTVVQPSAPATFSTVALGSELILLDEDGNLANQGEAFLVPPSMGLSRDLLNRDHYEVYYADTPGGPDGRTLRRHGDRIQRFANGYFRAHGRMDDSMNLGGIKISSLQLEEAVSRVGGIRETAAVAVSPAGGGPSRLIIHAVTDGKTSADADELKSQMQQEIRSRLNPLFKVHDVVIVAALPRTASNKVMRRTLRAWYEEKMS